MRFSSISSCLSKVSLSASSARTVPEEAWALIATWHCERDEEGHNLTTTIKDWPMEMLKAFARDGYRCPAFQMTVQVELSYFDGDECRMLPLPMPMPMPMPMQSAGAAALIVKAYEWCAPAVLERLAELLTDD